MSGLKHAWRLLACCLLVACVATRPVESAAEGCETASEAAPFEQLCAEDGSLLALCDERQCGVYVCREVMEFLTAGQVRLARQLAPPLPSPGPGIERYRGNEQGVLRDTRPVFIIPWRPKPQPELLPSQKQLLADAEAQRRKPYEGHHIYSRAFRAWFTERGIDIDAYILPLEVAEHRRIHRGANGGPWNEAWSKFIANNRKASPQEIHQHAGKLIYEFGLFGVVLPYKLWTLQPPPL